MLAIHWTPVANTKNILKNGITKSKNGLYCFPLTGHYILDKWWVHFLNQYNNRQRLRYNGVVFKIKQQDLPAYFGIWLGATNKDNFTKEIKNIKVLQLEYRKRILYKLGEQLATRANINFYDYDYEKTATFFEQLATKQIQQSPQVLDKIMNDLDFMQYTFEDIQIVLSNAVAANRIKKIIPQGNEFGKTLRLKRKNNS